jgi:hypothetical protein
MPSHASSIATPSLVEVLKALGREWRALWEQSQAIPESDPDSESCRALLLMDQQHFEHPIYDLFRLIEEHVGIDRGTLEQVAWRLNTPLGLAPLTRPWANRPRPDPEWDDFLDHVPTNHDRPEKSLLAMVSVCKSLRMRQAAGRRQRGKAKGPESRLRRRKKTVVRTSPHPKPMRSCGMIGRQAS